MVLFIASIRLVGGFSFYICGNFCEESSVLVLGVMGSFIVESVVLV